jgi:NADH-quinone oxidoreductase subunit M
VAAIIFGALSAAGQTDFKRLVAYSSINHMGFVVLAIAAAAWVGGSAEQACVRVPSLRKRRGTANVQHGLSAAGMFFLVGVLYDRAHTRDLQKYGGLFAILPVYGAVLIFVSMLHWAYPV